MKLWTFSCFNAMHSNFASPQYRSIPRLACVLQPCWRPAARSRRVEACGESSRSSWRSATTWTVDSAATRTASACRVSTRSSTRAQASTGARPSCTTSPNCSTESSVLGHLWFFFLSSLQFLSFCLLTSMFTILPNCLLESSAIRFFFKIAARPSRCLTKWPLLWLVLSTIHTVQLLSKGHCCVLHFFVHYPTSLLDIVVMRLEIILESMQMSFELHSLWWFSS